MKVYSIEVFYKYNNVVFRLIKSIKKYYFYSKFRILNIVKYLIFNNEKDNILIFFN